MINYDSDDNEIDFKNLVLIFWSSKLKIFLITSFFVISSIIYSLSLPNIYQSNAVLAPTSSSNSNLSSLASQYSGMASLAGISIPSSSEVDKVAMAIEVIKSLSFFEVFVPTYDIYFALQATKGWDSSTNSLIVNPEIFNVSSNKWIDESNFSINGRPSMQSAHMNFLSQLDIEIDSKTRFVTISFKHFSPFIAKEIVDLLVIEINERTKAEDISVAQNSITFLEKEAARTKFSSIISAINILIEQQLEVITFANATPEYLLKTLSPPIASERKALPQRSLIVILSFILGVMISSIYILINHYFLTKPKL